jgi:hypothetical protein
MERIGTQRSQMIFLMVFLRNSAGFRQRSNTRDNNTKKKKRRKTCPRKAINLLANSLLFPKPKLERHSSSSYSYSASKKSQRLEL